MVRMVMMKLGMYRISGSVFRMAGYPAVFLLSGSSSGSGPLFPRNRISESDNSCAQMWPINLTKLLVCSGLKPFPA